MTLVSQIRTEEEYDAVIRNGLVIIKLSTQEYDITYYVDCVFEHLAKEYKNVRFVEVDIIQWAHSMPIQLSTLQHIPTFRFFKNGQLAQTQHGVYWATFIKYADELQSGNKQQQQQQQQPAPSIEFQNNKNLYGNVELLNYSGNNQQRDKKNVNDQSEEEERVSYVSKVLEEDELTLKADEEIQQVEKRNTKEKEKRSIKSDNLSQTNSIQEEEKDKKKSESLKKKDEEKKSRRLFKSKKSKTDDEKEETKSFLEEESEKKSEKEEKKSRFSKLRRSKKKEKDEKDDKSTKDDEDETRASSLTSFKEEEENNSDKTSKKDDEEEKKSKRGLFKSKKSDKKAEKSKENNKEDKKKKSSLFGKKDKKSKEKSIF